MAMRRDTFEDERIQQESEEGWQSCLDEMRKHDIRMIRDWNEEIDALLLFAALFSAVVTTFVVDSYKSLQSDPQDASVQLLAHISSQLASLAVSPGFINSTQPAASSHTDFTPSASSIRINLLWFTSLVCSLITALFAIFARQWLRQYVDWEALSAKQSVRLRQLRYDGLQRWGIAPIMTALPLLLQISLALFFVGLLELLWSLHRTVAIVITSFVSISLALVFVSAIAPIFDAACPYRSPLSWVLYRMSVFPMWALAYSDQLWTLLLMSLRKSHRRYLPNGLASSTPDGARSIQVRLQPSPKLALDTEDISRSLAREMPPEWTARDIYTLGLGRNPLESKASLCDTRALSWIHRSRFDTRVRERILMQCLDDLRPWDQANITYMLTAEAYGSSLAAFLQSLRSGDWRTFGSNWWMSSDVYMRMGIRAYTQAFHANAAHLSGGEGVVTRYDILLLLDFVQWRCSKAIVVEEYWPFLMWTLDMDTHKIESPDEATRIYNSVIDLLERRPSVVRDIDIPTILQWAIKEPRPGEAKPSPNHVLNELAARRMSSTNPLVTSYERIAETAIHACATVIERGQSLSTGARGLLAEFLGIIQDVHNAQRAGSYPWPPSFLRHLHTIACLDKSLVPRELVQEFEASHPLLGLTNPDDIWRLRQMYGLSIHTGTPQP